MRYLKLYEDLWIGNPRHLEEVGWTLNKLTNFLDERDNMFIREQNLVRRLEEFLFYNPKLLPTDVQNYIKSVTPEDFEDSYYDAFDVYKVINAGDRLEIELSWNDNDEHDRIYLNKEQIQDLVEYMNDTEIYKNAKKYNL